MGEVKARVLGQAFLPKNKSYYLTSDDGEQFQVEVENPMSLVGIKRKKDKRTVDGEGFIPFKHMPRFKRVNDAAWDRLFQMLKSEFSNETKEGYSSVKVNRVFSLAFRMSLMTEHNTASLAPLGEKYSATDLVYEFGSNRNYILEDIALLKKLEVIKPIGRLKVWYFNPFLSFDGKKIYEDLLFQFKDSEFVDKDVYDRMSKEFDL